MITAPRHIKSLLADGETDRLEFKISFGKGVIESLVAFANHEGGKVIIGVDDKGGDSWNIPGPRNNSGMA